MKALRVSPRWLAAAFFLGTLSLPGCSSGPVQPAANQPAFVRVMPTSSAVTGTVQTPVSVSASFNGTAIPRGRVIWFSGVLSYTGPKTHPVTFHVDQSSVQFTADGTDYNVVIPNGTVVLSPTATSASTVYDSVSQTWLTTAPFAAADAVLLGAGSWTVPVDLPGGIKPVTWQAVYTTDAPGASFHWRWSAAVYTGMSDNPADLGVKPVDGDKFSAYGNSDHAGTPENFKKSVTGGAMGGGGSNFTGGLSGDFVVVPGPCADGPLNGYGVVSGDHGGTLSVGRFTIQVPAGAYKGDATIGVSVPDQGVLQCNLSISPASANGFRVPVTLTTSYAGANVVDPNALVEVWFDESSGLWRPVLGTSVDPANKEVVAPLAHFSRYGVVNEGKAGW